MQSWNTVEEVDEEMDIFAELGAVQTVVAPVQSMDTTNSVTLSDDPLAAFMEEEEEETLTADSLFALEDEPDGAFEFISEPQVAVENTSGPVVTDTLHTPLQSLSNEVITELLEVLVKTELNSRNERGENWLSGLSADAVAKVESAKVVKLWQNQLSRQLSQNGPTAHFSTHKLRPCTTSDASH